MKHGETMSEFRDDAVREWMEYPDKETSFPSIPEFRELAEIWRVDLPGDE